MIIKTYRRKAHYQNVLELFSHYPKIFPPYDMKLIDRDLKYSSSNHYFKYVAIEEEKVAGFISLYRNEDSTYSWQVSWYAVHSSFRKRGVGFALMEKLLEKVKERNIRVLIAETCACDENKPARRLYKKAGFIKVGTIPNYYKKNHSKITYNLLKS